MPNTNTDALIPQFWDAFDEIDMGEYPLPGLVNRRVENQLGNLGEKVIVPITPEFGDADDWDGSSAITATSVTQETVEVALDKSKRKTFSLTAKELSMRPYDLIQNYGVPAIKSILRNINRDIYLELIKSPFVVDHTSAAIDEKTLVNLGALLDNSEVASANRAAVLAPDDYATLLKINAFNTVQNSGTNTQQTGMLGQKFGFNLYKSNTPSKFTPADVTGAVNNVAGYAIGATSMAVDAFNDDANPIRQGDMFKIAGDPTWYTVQSTTKTTGDTTGISFLPGLVSAAANDAVITVTPTRSLLTFTPNAIGFAAKTFAPLNVDGVRSVVSNVMGIPIRITTWHNGNLGVNVQYDVLYGSKLVKNSRVAKAIIA